MTLEKALRWVVLAGVFLLPFIVLYVSRSLFFPFITGKNFAFRIIVEIIAGGWLALALINPAYRPRRSWLLWALGAFVLLIGISDIFGTYPLKSFWSNFERMEGWVTLAHLLVYFVVASATLNTERLWRNWWHTSLGISALVGLYGLLQLAGFITINQGSIRLDATFGNSTYLGVYMLFHISIAGLFLARAWAEKAVEKRFAYTIFYGSLMALNSFILFFTATRGAIIGLAVTAILSAFIMIVLAPRSRVAWRAGALIAGFVVLAGGLWLAQDTAVVQKIEPLRRLATMFSDGTTHSRFMNWGMAIEGFKERPILGWGQENYAAVFDKYYDPNMYAQEPWFDRVHNIFFDWLIAGGILGLLAYLSIYVFALLSIWRSSSFAPYERAILTGLLAGYFFYLIFTFDNITSYLFFISLLAYIAVRSAPEVQIQEVRTTSAVPLFAAAGAIVATCAAAWFVNADALAQNRAIIQALSPQENITKNLEYFTKATTYSGVGTQEAREQFSQAAISIVGAEGVSQDIKEQFVRGAYDAMQAQMRDAPLNARFPFFLGILLDHAGAYPEAQAVLTKAHELSPRKQSILFEFGLNAFARGANDEAVAHFKEAYELAPVYRDAEVYYISALIRAGKDAEAAALLNPLIEADTATDARIASAFAARGQFSAIAEIWKAHTTKNPADIEARFVLASAYFSAGNRTAALAELQAVKKEFPESAAQADQLIQQVNEAK